MKQKDILTIVGIAIVAGIFSLVLSRVLFVSSKSRQQSVEVVAPISTTFQTPSTVYFNTNSVDPTLTIEIGGDSNPAPFKGAE